jgi:hypothetical protein
VDIIGVDLLGFFAGSWHNYFRFRGMRFGELAQGPPPPRARTLTSIQVTSGGAICLRGRQRGWNHLALDRKRGNGPAKTQWLRVRGEAADGVERGTGGQIRLRSEWARGKERKSRASMTLKMVLLAPMPRASESTTTATNRDFNECLDFVARAEDRGTWGGR